MSAYFKKDDDRIVFWANVFYKLEKDRQPQENIEEKTKIIRRALHSDDGA